MAVGDLKIYRQNDLQSILANYRCTYAVTRSIINVVGSYSDIRPGQPNWSGIIARMRLEYALPDIIIPCTAYQRTWWQQTYLKYMSNFYLPEFG